MDNSIQQMGASLPTSTPKRNRRIIYIVIIVLVVAIIGWYFYSLIPTGPTEEQVKDSIVRGVSSNTEMVDSAKANIVKGVNSGTSKQKALTDAEKEAIVKSLGQ